MRSWVAVVAVLCLAACQGKRNAACVGALPGVPPGRPADSKRRQDNSHGGGRWRGLAATLYLSNACACSPGADAEWTMPKRGPRGDATCAGGKCQKVRPVARRRGTRAHWHASAGRESALRLAISTRSISAGACCAPVNPCTPPPFLHPRLKLAQYASCELRVCTGLCREYYPQVRKFLKEVVFSCEQPSRDLTSTCLSAPI